LHALIALFCALWWLAEHREVSWKRGLVLVEERSCAREVVEERWSKRGGRREVVEERWSKRGVVEEMSCRRDERLREAREK